MPRSGNSAQRRKNSRRRAAVPASAPGDSERWAAGKRACFEVSVYFSWTTRWYAFDSLFRTTAMAIKLSKDTEERLLDSLQRYCANNFDEEIGNLKAQLLLDFCVREIGPSIYNQAVQDAQKVMQEKVTELETNCYETEFAYWQKKR
jgi:uncharacterized protein (DUF2164 family)